MTKRALLLAAALEDARPGERLLVASYGDGAAVAAPLDERIVYYEQMESVWPVHGSVLVVGGRVYCVAGRSMFLDGGLQFLFFLGHGSLLSRDRFFPVY